jgi:hypothetical protein
MVDMGGANLSVVSLRAIHRPTGATAVGVVPVYVQGSASSSRVLSPFAFSA